MNKYTKKLRDADTALKLLRRHSIDAVSEPEGFAPMSTRQLDKSHGEFEKFRQTTMDPSQLISSIKLMMKVSHVMSAVQCGAAGSLRVAAELGTKADGVPAYFLPWDSRGGTVEMTIPAGAGNEFEKHPQLFFTAALSGCSIIIKGKASNPTIVHAGSGQLPLPYDANTFWKDFVEHLDSHPDPGIRNARTGKVKAQATKGSYVSGMEVPSGRAYPATLKTTQHAVDFKRKLSDHYGDQLEIADVVPWGAVFGIRTGGDWAFYLQENANITYFMRRKIQQVLEYTRGEPVMLPDKWVRMMGPQHCVSRPMAVSPFFPAGTGAAKLTTRWRSLVRSDQMTDATEAYALDG